jgi:tetratricopeptide (TPR) repeat protein
MASPIGNAKRTSFGASLPQPKQRVAAIDDSATLGLTLFAPDMYADTQASRIAQNRDCKLSLLQFVILLLAVGGFARGQTVSVEDLFRSGAQAMHEGRYPDAESKFKAAVRLAPQMAEAHLDLGLALMRQGKIADAAVEIESAVRLNPEMPGSHMFLGVCEYQMHRLDDARLALQKEVELDSKNAAAFMWLGVVELAAGRPEQAVGPLDLAADLSPKDLTILDYRGQAHNQVAKNSYSRMFQLDPNSWHVHRLQAQLYADEDRHKEAIAEYRSAILSEPRNSDLYEALGEEYRKTSQLPLAHEAYAKELELSPGNGVAMYNLGMIDIEQDNAKDGVPLLEQVVKFYADAPVAKYYLGRGLARLGRNDEAVRVLREAAQEASSGEVAKRSFYELSHLYRAMKRPADAQEALNHYLKLKAQIDSEGAQQAKDFQKLNTASGPEVTVSPTQ